MTLNKGLQNEGAGNNSEETIGERLTGDEIVCTGGKRENEKLEGIQLRDVNGEETSTTKGEGVVKESSKPNAAQIYEVGDLVKVKWADDSWHSATVIETQKLSSSAVRYYVHYEGFDRRLDEWVETTNIQTVAEFEQSESAKKRGYRLLPNGNSLEI